MINLKNMYKNSKHGILMKTFLFVAFLFLSLGLYFCFAPKNEVSGEEGNDAESSFTITLQGSNLNKLVQSGTATYNSIDYTMSSDGKISVPVESGSRDVEVILTACDGATISSVTKVDGLNPGSSSNPEISSNLSSDNKTYKFTISDCKPGGKITCNVSGTVTQTFNITLQGSNDVDLNQLVENATATYNGIQGTPAYSYNNDTKEATLSVPMESGSRDVEVTLTACSGVIIGGVTGPSSDASNPTISNGSWNSGNYTFTISNCSPGGKITCNVSGYKTSTITLQGIKTSQENPTFEQKIGDYVKTATAQWGNGENDKVTVDNVSNGTETITLNDVAFPPNAEVTVTLTPKPGYEVIKVIKVTDNKNQTISQSNTFTITEYPGQYVTYTVESGLRKYPLQFKDTANKPRFIVSKSEGNSQSEGNLQSVDINYNTPTPVTITLDTRCSQSDISLAPHGQFDGGTSGYKVSFKDGNQTYESDVEESSDILDNVSQVLLTASSLHDVGSHKTYAPSQIDVYKFNYNSYNYYVVKEKSDNKIRIFKKKSFSLDDSSDDDELHVKLFFYDEPNYEDIQLVPSYKNDKIEYIKKSAEYEKVTKVTKVTYEFKLLDPNIQITDNDYFIVEGIKMNIYNVTVKCNDGLSGIAGNLELKYKDPEKPSQIKDAKFSSNDLCATIQVSATDLPLFTLSATQEVGASNYVKWVKKNKNNTAKPPIGGHGVSGIEDGGNNNIESAEITLNEVHGDIDITLNAPDLIKNIPLNFEMDEKFKELISIYNAKPVKSETSDPDQSTGQYEKGNPLENNTDRKLEVSILSAKTFHYIVAANSAGEGITENDIKSMLLDENDNDNPKPKITAESSLTGIKVQVGYQENAAVTSDYDKHFIILTVTIGPVDPTNEPKEFNINLSGMQLPTRTLTVESQENMAGIIGLDDGISGENSENGKIITKYKFDYNSALEFNIKPTDRYEIYNPDTDIKITKKVDNVDKEIDDFGYDRITIEGKEGYNIKIKPEKYDITVKITFDPLHKVISLNNVEGFSYYEVRKKSNENENETAAATIQIDGEDYEVGKNKIHGKYTVKVGDTFYFAVQPEQGYNLKEAKILLDGKNLDSFKEIEGYRIYKIENIENDPTISGSISKLKHTVTFKGDNNYTDAITYKRDGVEILGSVEVEYGDNVSFTVDIGEKYNKSKFKIKDEHGVEINLVDGKYLLVNITSDKTITVKDIALNSYNINFVKSDAVKFLDENSSELSGIKSVMYGDKLSFKVEARDGYAITEQMKVISVSESGVRAEVKPDKNGNYSLNNVTEDYEISIENVENVMFKVTLAPTDGVTYLNDGGAVISGVSKVKYGNNFEFSVNVDDAYDDSIAGMYIIVNGGNLSAQKLATGRYIIPNITEDVLIRVGNIRKNSYNVTLVKVDGMDYYDASKKVINGDNSVNHGDSFSFKIGLYPAYSNSSVKVMLGNEELTANDSGFYTVPKVIENKTVTIVGVEENEESKVVNTINNLPSSVSDLTDVDAVIAATRDYEKLSDEQKQKVSNIDALRRLQEQVKEFHHVSNDVRISGVDWNIKLVAVPISFDKEACTRIYKKLNSEYIVSLYDVYLWDVINDVKYNLPEGKEATITLPKPDLTYFEKPTGIHEKDGGKISYLSLSIGSDIVRFTTDSFSPMGIIANRSLAPGRSSLLDAADANIGLIRDYALSTFGSGSVNNKGDSYSDINLTDANDSTNLDGTTGNINEKFKSRNNPVTAQGSAIRLALVLMLLILLAIVIIIIIEGIKRRKKEKSN